MIKGFVGRHPAPWRTEPREKFDEIKIVSSPDALPSAMLDTYFRSPTPLSLYLFPDPCSLWPTSRALDIPPIAKPSGNRSYSTLVHLYKTLYHTIVLLPDGPTMMRWQGPTSSVHSSNMIKHIYRV